MTTWTTLEAFEGYRGEYQDKVRTMTIVNIGKGMTPQEAREAAQIFALTDLKQIQDSLGEKPPLFVVDNPNFYYPGMPERAIEGK